MMIVHSGRWPPAFHDASGPLDGMDQVDTVARSAERLQTLQSAPQHGSHGPTLRLVGLKGVYKRGGIDVTNIQRTKTEADLTAQPRKEPD